MSRIQLLVSAVNQDLTSLPSKLNIQSDAVIINQCGRDETETISYTDTLGAEHEIRLINCDERGVGLSRNRALDSADREFLQFSDEDIVLDEGYIANLEKEFDTHPEADMLLINVKAAPGRETYWNTDYSKVNWKNYGRYPAYAIAARTSVLKASGVKFSPLFGGGAKYSNGEDSLFLKDCLKAGLRIYRTTVTAGHEVSERPSTWFTGFNDKFFFDRGVLYHFLYGHLAWLFALRFILVKKSVMCREKPAPECFKLMLKGIKQGVMEDK